MIKKVIKVVISDCFNTNIGGGILHEKTYFMKDKKVVKDFIGKIKRHVDMEELEMEQDSKVYAVQKDGCVPLNVSFYGDFDKAKDKCLQVGNERMGAIANVLEYDIYSDADEAINRKQEAKKIHTVTKPWG